MRGFPRRRRWCDGVVEVCLSRRRRVESGMAAEVGQERRESPLVRPPSGARTYKAQNSLVVADCKGDLRWMGRGGRGRCGGACGKLRIGRPVVAEVIPISRRCIIVFLLGETDFVVRMTGAVKG